MVLNEEKIQSENRHAFEHLNGLMMRAVPAEKARLFSGSQSYGQFSFPSSFLWSRYSKMCMHFVLKKIHYFKKIIFQPFERIMPQRMLCQLKYFDDLTKRTQNNFAPKRSFLIGSRQHSKFGNDSWSLRGREMTPHGVEGAGSQDTPLTVPSPGL